MGTILMKDSPITLYTRKAILNDNPKDNQQELEVKSMAEPKPERPPPDGIVREIFDSSMAQNTQMTVKKEMRERLGIEVGDRLFVHVLKVISPTGDMKYEWKGEIPEESGEVVPEEEKEEGN